MLQIDVPEPVDVVSARIIFGIVVKSNGETQTLAVLYPDLQSAISTHMNMEGTHVGHFSLDRGPRPARSDVSHVWIDLVQPPCFWIG
jgi:hypothetical protein